MDIDTKFKEESLKQLIEINKNLKIVTNILLVWFIFFLISLFLTILSVVSLVNL